MAPQLLFEREVDNQHGPHERYYPSSLRHLSIWAYLALAFAVLATTAIFAYATYSCYHSAPKIEPQLRPAPRITSKEREATRDHRKWKSESQRGMIQPNDHSRSLTMDDTSISFESPSLSAPPLAYPVDYPAHAFTRCIQNTTCSVTSQTPLVFDSHNIRFVAPKNSLMSPSTAMIWQDPKLSPVQGIVAASTRMRPSPALAHTHDCRGHPSSNKAIK